MKIYLDTNIVSAIERKHQPLEVEAVSEVLRRSQVGELTLVTSRLTGDEIKRCTGPHAPAIWSLYESISKIPYVEYEVHVGFDSYWDEMGGWSNPLYDVDESWTSLRRLGLHEADAHHVMLALKDRCNVFLTCDRRTVLKHRQKIEPVHQIRLLKPSEFLVQSPQ